MPVFEETLELPCGVDVLFDFLARPSNVAKVSDPRLGLRFVSAPEIVLLGSKLEFQIQKHGMLQNAVHEIVTFDRPRLIVELQTQGPLKAWRHEHHFEATTNGTRMRDRIEFEPPTGILGMLYGTDKILDSLEENFFHRQETLKRLSTRGEIVPPTL